MLCFHRKGCHDSITGAWVIAHRYGLDIRVFPTRPGQDERSYVNENESIFIVGFIPYAEDLKYYCEKAGDAGVTIFYTRGHDNDLARIEEYRNKYSNLSVIHVKDSSVCLLTWQYFFKDELLPDLVRFVHDSATKTYRYPETRAYISYLGALEQNIGIWRRVHYRPLPWILERGELLARRRRESIDYHIIKATHIRRIGEDVIPAVNAPNYLASEILEILCENYPYAISYYTDTECHYRISFRSRKNGGANVKLIAEQFGGGGYPHSAGVRMKELPGEYVGANDAV